MLIFGFSLILGVVGYYTALISLANSIVKTDNFTDFIRSVQSKVYALVTVTFCMWLLFDIRLFLAYAMSYIITLCMVDYKHTYDELLKD